MRLLYPGLLETLAEKFVLAGRDHARFGFSAQGLASGPDQFK